LIDLPTAEGARMVNAHWRYSDATIVGADFNAPGPDLKPSGQPIKTFDYENTKPYMAFISCFRAFVLSCCRG
jgi:hypothetical protein